MVDFVYLKKNCQFFLALQFFLGCPSGSVTNLTNGKDGCFRYAKNFHVIHFDTGYCIKSQLRRRTSSCPAPIGEWFMSQSFKRVPLFHVDRMNFIIDHSWLTPHQETWQWHPTSSLSLSSPLFTKKRLTSLGKHRAICSGFRISFSAKALPKFSGPTRFNADLSPNETIERRWQSLKHLSPISVIGSGIEISVRPVPQNSPTSSRFNDVGSSNITRERFWHAAKQSRPSS